jgi:hypothetical protein
VFSFEPVFSFTYTEKRPNQTSVLKPRASFAKYMGSWSLGSVTLNMQPLMFLKFSTCLCVVREFPGMPRISVRGPSASEAGQLDSQFQVGPTCSRHHQTGLIHASAVHGLASKPASAALGLEHDFPQSPFGPKDPLLGPIGASTPHSAEHHHRWVGSTLVRLVHKQWIGVSSI